MSECYKDKLLLTGKLLLTKVVFFFKQIDGLLNSFLLSFKLDNLLCLPVWMLLKESLY